MASGRPNKLAFLSQAAPAGYVAGLGRGASGFTTRSDIGPAREGPSAEAIAAARAKRGEEEEDEDERFQDPEEEHGLFASAVYERDDEEADRIWESVDRQMDERRRKQREARERAELEDERRKTPKIQAQFADLKRNLTSVSAEEWAALPEPGNLTAKRRKAAASRESRDNRTYALPDSVLVGARDQNQVQNEAADVDMDGTKSSLGGTISSLTEIGEARNKVFSHQLDQASSSSSIANSGLSSSIDPKGYLTELSGISVKSDVEIGDIKKARSLLDSVIKTNPKHAPGWIAAARLEEVAGKMAVARKVIAQGCEQCPKSEDVWLENARLNTTENAKVILAKAIQYLSQSVNIWLRAEKIESDTESKKRVLRKAIEHVPNSVMLWKRLVNLEESPEDARILLAGAVEAIPLSIELWLTLARLSTPEEAKSVLNKARRTIPTSHEIWIAAARLLEQMGESHDKVDKTIAAAVSSLEKAGAMLSREQWFREAEQAERDGSPLTCAAIIKASIYLDIDAEDRNRVWVEDAESALEQNYPETARAIYQCALLEFPDDVLIWQGAVNLERVHGTRESLEKLLEQAVTNCPKAEKLWLVYAEEKAREHDIERARQVLIRAFDNNLGSEAISLAAAALEAEQGDKRAASMLLLRARREVNTVRVWIKSVQFERSEGSIEAALSLTQDGLKQFPQAAKLHMMHGQLLESQNTPESLNEARDAYTNGRRNCPESVALWLLSSRLEEKMKLSTRARALLEKARRAHDKSDAIWAESVAVELRSGSVAQAKSLLARGLQACPTSGVLWSMSIWQEPKQARKTRAADALRRSGDSSFVICTVARLFWQEGKYAQARSWFDKTIAADRDWGDGWGWWYAFEDEQARNHGGDAKQQLLEKVAIANPRHGEEWQLLRKAPENAKRSAAELLPELASILVKKYSSQS
ncbi:U4/U6 x U5 tri-snRNP complex subunit Prp1 [Malassezia yamatoensis]|uniref:U4/U6 x U5 tri-snRNP complex subunit Prp1 n=1 Tax=Malassezia yamatoensis TaxID=253288 RepID=A0AAJ5YRP9_9BASI|nr:U4/U6 x U5 tri-snRNP complex subunit Prp1 [Malassezia yamatoensis]